MQEYLIASPRYVIGSAAEPVPTELKLPTEVRVGYALRPLPRVGRGERLRTYADRHSHVISRVGTSSPRAVDVPVTRWCRLRLVISLSSSAHRLLIIMGLSVQQLDPPLGARHILLAPIFRHVSHG